MVYIPSVKQLISESNKREMSVREKVSEEAELFWSTGEGGREEIWSGRVGSSVAAAVAVGRSSPHN